MNVVISQSMLFPWVGMLEQIRLADCFVHYDDVPFSKGSFTNRVQIKTPQGSRWMTVPLDGLKLGQSIETVAVMPKDLWQGKHLDLLKQSLDGAPYRDDAIDLVQTVYNKPHAGLGMLARDSMLAVANYFGLYDGTCFLDVASLGIATTNSQRVLEVVKAVGGTQYISGHGGRNYLKHDQFDEAGVRVSYMEYECVPYSQLHGDFIPYVSSLDLIANCGKEGARRICSQAIYWREVF